METRRLLWLIALIFSVVLMVQHFELPYGYLLSSLLSFGNSQVPSLGSSSSSFKSTGSSRTFSGGSNSTKMNSVREGLNTTGIDDLGSKNGDDSKSRDFLEINDSRNEKVVRNKSLPAPEKAYKNGHNLQPSNDSSVINSSENNGANISRNVSPQPSVMGKDAAIVQKNNGTSGFIQNNLSASVDNSSVDSTRAKKRLMKGPPAVVVPICEMNDMLLQSRVSYKFMKPRWASKADIQLLNAKTLIEKAQITERTSHIDVNIYRNFSAFMRSYELMEQTLKIYIYKEGKKPVFHQSELGGIYASEGWFMKLLEENKHFVTKNADEAHLFYLPFSSRLLQETLYVPNSHSRKNLVRYLSNYLQTIKTKHRFWNRTDGSDHFLVACHDWAQAETSRIMKNCIRALCNAEAKGGFDFVKDVSLPETYIRYPQNPLKGIGGKPASQRQILTFFAGKMHGYLRPILLNYWENKDPDMKIFGKIREGKGQTSYIQYMKSSKYCISAKGYEPYTPRVVEAIFYECVPVIISDNYVPPFFETLNWESFAVFVLEKDIPNLKNILRSVPEKRYREMQERVRQVQKHFLWHSTPVKYDIFHMILHSIWYTRVSQIRPG